jgi:hypothetical protein
MYTSSFCKDISEMLDWECGSYNRGHTSTNWKHTCSYQKHKKNYYTAPDRFALDKPMNPYWKMKKGKYANAKDYLKHMSTLHKKEYL